MSKYIDSKWNKVMKELPYQQLPYSKKNWGNPNHSLCSYQGKLKPAIAAFLVQTFVPSGGTLLDPFSGVGTIPFEGALNGRLSYGFDISPLAYYVSSAKIKKLSTQRCEDVINALEEYINSVEIPQEYYQLNASFGYNKSLSDYYDSKTFQEILAARLFFTKHQPKTAEECLVISALLHILHGNRPYALSRRSHPIVPYAPTGDFEYKNVIEKVKEKMQKALAAEHPKCFKEGQIYLQDSTLTWPEEVNNLDAIITSPPFYDSTRFYLANWIRLWFTGWNQHDFDCEPDRYVDEKQKISFEVYNSIFEQARERLKPGGYFVMHLGKSTKCDMGEVLRKQSQRWFPYAKLYDESVNHCQKFGIKDIGTVTDHQYLVMH